MAKKSPALFHFDELVETPVGSKIFKGKCKHCSSVVSTKYKSTSNLLTHLKVRNSHLFPLQYVAIVEVAFIVYRGIIQKLQQH